VVYVVRHADSGDRSKWDGPDDLRPLSEKGWKQAAALADHIEGADLLISSHYVRCRQTLEPLAERLGLPIQDEPRLVEGTPFREFLELVTTPAPPSAMCTHGDIVTNLVDYLLRRKLADPASAGSSKASIWALEVEGGAISAARYIPPPRQQFAV
jgi:broad specificity phosphatase PhoE